MVYFPKDVFSNILAYCDDSIERKQRYLWSKLVPHRDMDFDSDFEHRSFCCNYWFYDELSHEETSMGWTIDLNGVCSEDLGIIWYDGILEEWLRRLTHDEPL